MACINYKINESFKKQKLRNKIKNSMFKNHALLQITLVFQTIFPKYLLIHNIIDINVVY